MEECIKKLIRTEISQCYRGSRTITLGGKVMMSDDSSIVVVVSSTSGQTINLNWFMRRVSVEGKVKYKLIGMISGIITKGDNGDHIVLSRDGSTLAITCIDEGKRGIAIYQLHQEDGEYTVRKLDSIKGDELINKRYGESLAISEDGGKIFVVGMLTNNFIIIYSYFRLNDGYKLSYRSVDKVITNNILISSDLGKNPNINLSRKSFSNKDMATAYQAYNELPDYSAKVVTSRECRFLCVLVNRDDKISGAMELVLLVYEANLLTYEFKYSISVADFTSVNDANIVMDALGNKVIITIPDENMIYSLVFNDGVLDHEKSEYLKLDDSYVKCGDSLAISGDGNTLCLGEAGTLEVSPKYYISSWNGNNWHLTGKYIGAPSDFRLSNDSSVALDYHGVVIVTGERGSNVFRDTGELSLGTVSICDL